MSFVDNLVFGSLGIAEGFGLAPDVILYPNGTIQGVNFTANINSNVSFNAPLAVATFETLTLSNIDPLFNQSADRLTVDFNDGAGANAFQFAITSDASLLMEQIGVGAQWELQRTGGLLLSGVGAGVQVDSVNGNPNLTLYAPDQFGAVGLYNSANAGYEWRIQQNGNTQITDSVTISGNLTVNGTITGSITENYTPYVVTSQGNPANVFTGPSGDSVVLINVVGGTPNLQYNAVLLPVDAPNGTTVSVVLANPGSGFPIVQTTSPAGFQFRGQGSQLGQVNLSNFRGGSSTQNYTCNFTFVRYGGAFGDDWLVTVS